MRLDKLLSHYGIGTRKEVKNYIRKGFVKVNHEMIKKDDFKVDIEHDIIEFAGERIIYKPYVYIMLNKPAGYVSATADQIHPTVIDLIDDYFQYDLFPVGRLDIDTEGLMLITNDGDFAHRLLAPSRNHSKIYYAKVKGVMTEEDKKAFFEGIKIDHYLCKPAHLKILKTENCYSEVEIEIFEGKFHQVKKMVQAVGKEVIYLKRIKIRQLELDQSLQLGQYRELFDNELVDLMKDL